MVPGDISEGICAERKRPLQWAPDPGQQNKAPIPFLLLKEGTPTGWIPFGLRFSLRLFLRFSNLEACFFLKPPRIQKRHPANVRPWHLVARRHHVVVIHILDKGPWNIDAVLFPLLKIKGGGHQSAHQPRSHLVKGGGSKMEILLESTKSEPWAKVEAAA